MEMSVSSQIGHVRHPRACVALIDCRALARWHTHLEIMLTEIISCEITYSLSSCSQNYLFVAEHNASVEYGCGRSEGGFSEQNG
jgi:hypothetical protein